MGCVSLGLKTWNDQSLDDLDCILYFNKLLCMMRIHFVLRDGKSGVIDGGVWDSTLGI